MPDIAAIIEAGSANAWLLLPAALLLGALHALEPGHSKSMMAAFIVAVNGTPRQAALLAIAATIGHTIVIWILALLAWRLGDAAMFERAEPWLLLFGGALLIILSLRILHRASGFAAWHHHHRHGDDDSDPARNETHAHDHHHHDDDDEDAHAAAHAAEIRNRFTAGPVTNAEIAWFGFSGGLMPCPAAFAVLLACLHQNAFGLGVIMVAAFSVGLALMLVAIGVAAAWGAGAIRSRFSIVERLSRWAPLISSLIVLGIGAVVVAQGLKGLGIA